MSIEKKIIDALKLNGLSDISINLYIKNLQKLNNNEPIKTLDFLNNPEEIAIKLKKYKTNTKKNFYASIVSILKYYNLKKYKKIYDIYNKILIDMNKEYNENENKHELTTTQKENWISREDIEKKYEELKAIVNELKKKEELNKFEYNKLFDYVLLSLYVLEPPRRNKDYQLMRILKKSKNNILNEFNYVDLKKHIFIFNNYKGSSKKGQVIINYHDDFNKIFKIYFKFHPTYDTEEEPFLLVSYDGKPLTKINDITYKLNSIFDGKKVGSTMLRHIYLSSKYNDDKVEEQNKDAVKMSHSISAQNKYIKKSK